MSRLKVSVVIPNYNTWDLVKRNVDACLKHDEALIDEIIVVDDYSPTINYIDFDPRVKVIRNPENYRYTKAVNQGLLAATGDIIVLLDSDAYPTHPFVARLCQLYTDDPKLGSVGFKTVNEKGEDTGNVMTEPSILSLISGQKIHGLLRNYNIFASKNILPFSCAVSFRAACLKDVGYLDENFQVLDADHDLSMRIYRSDWKLVYDNTIEIYHIGGGSIPKDHRRVLMFYQARWKLLAKYGKLKLKGISARLILFRFRLEELLLKFKNPAKAKDRGVIIQELKKLFAS